MLLHILRQIKVSTFISPMNLLMVGTSLPHIVPMVVKMLRRKFGSDAAKVAGEMNETGQMSSRCIQPGRKGARLKYNNERSDYFNPLIAAKLGLVGGGSIVSYYPGRYVLASEDLVKRLLL